MRNRRWQLVGLVLALSVAAVFAVPLTRDVLLASLARVPFQEGRPVRHWLRVLRGGGEPVRERAAHVLGKADPVTPEVLAGLTAGLGDSSYIVRRNCAEALGKLGPAARETAPALIAALKDADARVRWYVAWALGRIEPDAGPVVAALTVIARADDKVATRSSAITSLGKLAAAAAPAISVLIETLKQAPQAEANPAEAARDALCAIGAASIPYLIVACKDNNFRARANAARTLGDMGEKSRAGIPVLESMLADKEPLVRIQVAAALWKIDAQIKRTVPVLAAAVKSAPAEDKGDAMVILGAIGPGAGSAAQSLAKIGPAAGSAIAALQTMAKSDEDLDNRRAAAVEAIQK